MSDILIRGMEMPEHCGYCRFRYDGICHALQKTQYSMEECPLVPVPPHGDLIDADALIEDLKYDVELDAAALDSMEIVGDERRKIQDDKDFKQNCIFWIEDAPTIIQASE